MIEGLALDAVGRNSLEGSHIGVVMNSSEDLITRARSGEHDAFRQIFERYARPVLVFIYHLVGNRDVAEDLTQETFVRAYSHLAELRDKSKFSTWLFGIGKNVAREHLRAKQRHSQSFLPGDSSPYAHETHQTISPADELLGKELNAAMETALQLLDEDKRVVFALKVLQQRSYQEIAAITGFSLARVKTELHRARIEMRRRMRPFLETKMK